MNVKVGHRVFIRSIKRKGSVEYIDWPHLSLPYMYPIQIKLDRPYGDCDQSMYRTDAKDLKKLKDGKEVKAIWVDEATDVDLTQFFSYLRKLK